METFGKYQLVRRLGAGGMAEVFLARSTVAQGLAKLLVIKKIHPAFARSKHFVKMFVDEAKIALGLNHPNIVQVFDFGHVAHTFFLAMEYVEGADLLKVMQEGARVQRRVPYGLSAYIAQQIAKGLDYAHRKTDEYGEELAIVHRDISPQNVLVSWDGSVKIVDFGIARARDVEEEEGVVKGKFAYMSPEQARGAAVDRRSDIFSAGIVLFEMACARPLFAGKGKEILDVVRAGAIPRPRDVDPLLPQQLEEIILKALAYHAEDRYQTARDLQNALGRFQYQHAQSQDDLYDSSTLAQFVAQIVPRQKRAETRPTLVERAPGDFAASAAADLRARAGTMAADAPGSLAPAVAPTALPAGVVGLAVQTSPGSHPGTSPSASGTPSTPGTSGASGTSGVSAPQSLLTPAAPASLITPVPSVTEIRERKHVLVIEGLIAGVSALRRQVGDARAVQAVAEFFRIAENIAYKHEATLHQLGRADSGDAAPEFVYLVGVPTAGEDDASRAIRLALALVDALDGIGRDVEPELRLSVGIQRGVAVVTRRGGSAWTYELTETTTSFARRLAGEAQGGEVLVGGAVYRVARQEWNFEELATVDMVDDSDTSPAGEDTGGTQRRAKIYRLRGPKEREQRMRERGAADLLVGRDLELKALRDAYRQVALTRRKHHLLVIGEDGVGKRSLVSGFLKTLPPGEAMVLRSSCRASTIDAPFSIVADLARDLLGLAEGAAPREIVRRLHATAAMLYPGDADGREIQSLVDTMGMLLGVRSETGEAVAAVGGPDPALPGGGAQRSGAQVVDGPDPALPGGGAQRSGAQVVDGPDPALPGGGAQRSGAQFVMDADERHVRMGSALRRIEERLAKDQPVVVITEDAHWADSQSWDVFMEIAAEASNRPVLGVITARPDDRIRAAARDAQHTTILYLEELDADARVRLILDRFQPGDAADARKLADEIVAKTGGNPLFIREVFDSLVERGILAESKLTGQAGRYAWVKRDAPIQVPTSVAALLASRLDRLSSQEKEVLSRAAVYGRELHAADVAALVSRPVDAELQQLVTRGLIEATAHGHAFKNQITQTVAYDLVPIDERPALHKRAAERLAIAPGYRAGQDDAIIGRHFERAGDRARAAARYLAAAHHARDVRGNVEAFRLLTRALALLPREAHAERFAARSEREVILRSWARRPQQLRELHLMRREAETMGDGAKLAAALTRLGLFYFDVGKVASANQTLVPALAAARRAGDRLAEAEVLRAQAVLARSAGENAEALALAERGLALCGEDRGGLLQRAQILNIKGTTLWHMSRLRDAILAHSEALVIYRNLRVPRQEARALNSMGVVFTALGEFEEALVHYKRALKIDQDLGDRVQVAMKLANIGGVYVDLGDADKAEQYLVKAIGIAEQTKEPATLIDATITLGQAYLKRGEAVRARKLLERGLGLAVDGRSRYQEVRAMIYLGLARLAAGDPPTLAVELARRAADMARTAQVPVGEIFALAVEGQALGRLGLATEGAARAAEAVRLLDASRSTEGADEILFIHAKLAGAAGLGADAERSLARAHDELMSKARRLKDATLRATFLGSTHAREVIAARAGAR